MIDIRFDGFIDPDPAGTANIKDPLVLAHRHCASHRPEVLRSSACGCFPCCTIFAPTEITEWVEETGGTLAQADDPWTAICPSCGIDAVIGTDSSSPVDQPEFLQAMNARWFR